MNRFARRVLEQGESAIPPDAPAGLEQQAEDQALGDLLRATRTAPEVVARATTAVYDSRPLGSREFVYAPAPLQQVIPQIPDTSTFWLTPPFVVPGGRVAVVRLIGFSIDPMPFPNRAQPLRLALLRNGDVVPDHDIVLEPWMDDVATQVLYNEGDQLAMRLTYVSLSNVPAADPFPTFVRFVARGQLLLATGEPFEQLIGSAPPPPPAPREPEPEFVEPPPDPEQVSVIARRRDLFRQRLLSGEPLVGVWQPPPGSRSR